MDKWQLIIDVARCENCNNCALVTKDEHVGNDYPGYSAPHSAQGASVLRIRRQVRGATPMVDAAYLPTLCMHCDSAPCLKASGNDGSIRQRADGIVTIDPVKAKGRRELVDACPYGAIIWNEEQQLPQNWIFEAHRLDAGASTLRIADVCPTGVFETAKCEDAAMSARAAREQLRVLKPELGTRPRVWYRNLGRFDRCFIGGTLTRKQGEIEDCVEGAAVDLWKDGARLASTHSDAFGEFRFDGLEPDSGEYELRMMVGESQHARALTLASDSVYVGTIPLD